MDQKINSGIFQLNLLLRQANSKMLSLNFKSFLHILKDNPQEILKQTKDLQSELNLFLNRFEFYLKTVNREIFKFKSGNDIETNLQAQNIIEISTQDQKQQKLKIKQQKKIIKKPVIQESFIDTFCLTADFVSFAGQKIKPNKYEKICQNIFDQYSILNIKIPNMTNNRDLFEKILYVTWRLVNDQRQNTLQYEPCQKVIGYPTIFPFTYLKKGSLMKKFKNDQESSSSKSQGLFTDSRVEGEFEKILLKIQEHSQQLFEQIAEQKTSLVSLNDQAQYSQHQIHTSAKNTIQKKICYFKINYLSTLLLQFIKDQNIKPSDVNTHINLDLLQRKQLEEYLKEWTKTL